MIFFDNNALVCLYRPDAFQHEEQIKMQLLVENITKNNQRIGLPTPVLTEFLIGTNNESDRNDFIALFSSKNSIFQIFSFDPKSAFLCAAITEILKTKTGYPDEGSLEPWQRVKVDRQVLSIAKSNNASQLITSDRRLRNLCKQIGLTALPISDLPSPPPKKAVSKKIESTNYTLQFESNEDELSNKSILH